MIKYDPKQLPRLPGVYLFKDGYNAVIYIGKAKSLRHRVGSYFRHQNDDWKVNELIKEYALIEHIVTKNETEACLLEAQLIRDYQPKYNVLLTSGNPFIYLLFTQEELPTLTIVRLKKAKGTYFGPFLHKQDARKVYAYLVSTFKLHLCSLRIENGCLDYHLGRCAGSCKGNFDQKDYLFRLNLAQEVLQGNHKAFLKMLDEQTKVYNKNFEFEKSRHLLEYAQNFETIFVTIKTHFSEKKYAQEIMQATAPDLENVQDGLNELQNLLQLEHPIKTIDCFDISHFQSTYIVGSCIRFTDGKPDKNSFRRFKIRSLAEQNDYAALQEIVMRRYKNGTDFPDLILIDGGKGQLNAIKDLVPVTCISLAKREERLYCKNSMDGIPLDLHTPQGRLLIALRDYAHHFAISYHKLLRKKAVIIKNS
ncbi:MAG: GIY-YIG nuclease family protein [Candidatus Babeliaceae bacterium]